MSRVTLEQKTAWANHIKQQPSLFPESKILNHTALLQKMGIQK